MKSICRQLCMTRISRPALAPPLFFSSRPSCSSQAVSTHDGDADEEEGSGGEVQVDLDRARTRSRSGSGSSRTRFVRPESKSSLLSSSSTESGNARRALELIKKHGPSWTPALRRELDALDLSAQDILAALRSSPSGGRGGSFALLCRWAGTKPALLANPNACRSLLKTLAGLAEGPAFWRLAENCSDAKIAIEAPIFNALIHAYSRLGMADKVLEVLLRMRHYCRTNVFTYALAIAIFSKKGKLDKAMELLTEMKTESLAPNSVIFNSLIDGLLKQRDFDKATVLVNEMRSSGCTPDKYTYNIFLNGFVRADRLEDAIALFAHMLEEGGAYVNEVTCGMLIAGFAKADRIDEALALFTKMEELGMAPNSICYATLITQLLKVGRVEQARDFLEAMTSKHGFGEVQTCNAVLQALINKGCLDPALSLLAHLKKNGVKSNTVAYNSLFSGLLRVGRSDEASQIVKEMIENGCALTSSAYNLIVIDLVKNNQFEKARSFFSMIKEGRATPSSSVYNTLISGALKEERFDLASGFLKDMISDGYTPGCVTNNIFLHKFVKTGQFEWAYALFEQMEKRDKFTYSHMISCYLKQNKIESALSIFTELKEKALAPDQFIYSLLIRGLVRAGHLDQAVGFAEEMMKNLVCSYDVETASQLIMGLAAISEKHDLALSLFSRMKEIKIIPGQLTFDSLVHRSWKDEEGPQ